jgi:hypothetical protein
MRYLERLAKDPHAVGRGPHGEKNVPWSVREPLIKKGIMEILAEIEASTKRRRASLGNMLDSDVLWPASWADCDIVLELVKDTRRAIRAGETRSAALSAFRLGQAALNFVMRPLAPDAHIGLEVRNGGRAGAKLAARKRAKSSDQVKDMIEKAREMRANGSKLKTNALARILAPAHGMKQRTARRFLQNALPPLPQI